MQLIRNPDFGQGIYEISHNKPVFVPTFWELEFTDEIPNRIDKFSHKTGGLDIFLGEGGSSPFFFSQKTSLRKNIKYTLVIKYTFDFQHRTHTQLDYSFKILVGSRILNQNVINGLEEYHPADDRYVSRTFSFFVDEDEETKISLIVDTLKENFGRLYIYEVLLLDD